MHLFPSVSKSFTSSLFLTFISVKSLMLYHSKLIVFCITNWLHFIFFKKSFFLFFAFYFLFQNDIVRCFLLFQAIYFFFPFVVILLFCIFSKNHFLFFHFLFSFLMCFDYLLFTLYFVKIPLFFFFRFLLIKKYTLIILRCIFWFYKNHFYELNISLNSSPSIFSFSIKVFATLVNLSIFIVNICSAVL